MKVLTIIMAGGIGRELSCLTRQRGKPAMPMGGKYQLIDFSLSNAVNSGLTRIAVLAQYSPQPMLHHLGAGEPWGLGQAGEASLEVWFAGLERTGQAHYAGSADAVYQNSRFITGTGCDRVLVLSGDQIYRQDYRDLLRFQEQHGADVVVAAAPVPPEEAQRFGQLMLAADGRITHFYEKTNPPQSTLGSLGFYLFSTECLLERLAEDAADPSSRHDFGRDVLPRMVARDRVFAYPFQGYWQDAGTVLAYWQVNMDLLVQEAGFKLDDPAWKIHTRAVDRPPVRIGAPGSVHDSLIADGCVIEGQVIHSVLGPGVRVEPGAVVRDSVVMQHTRIRAGAEVDRCVLDEAVEVGPQAVLGADLGDRPNTNEPEILWSGISVVGQGARVPAGVVIGRNVRVDPGAGESHFAARQIPSGGTVKA